MWAERTEWGSMCDQSQLVVSRDDNILQSNTQCVYSIIHLSAQCVYFTLYIMYGDHQLLLPSGRLPPPLIESNQINHKNKWYSHLVIPKYVAIWLLDTHKPWLFQYEYEWVRTLFVMITNTISNYCFTGIQNVEIQTQAICVDCTEEFVSNEVIRVVLPTGEHEREPLYHWVELMNSLRLDLPFTYQGEGSCAFRNWKRKH